MSNCGGGGDGPVGCFVVVRLESRVKVRKHSAVNVAQVALGTSGRMGFLVDKIDDHLRSHIQLSSDRSKSQKQN